MEYLMNLNFTSMAWVFILPLALMIVDIITGYVNAWRSNNINSSKMRDGIGKKCAELTYILLGVLFKLAFGLNSPLILLVTYMCYMELNSILENCDKLGVPLHNKIKEKLNNGNKEDK